MPCIQIEGRENIPDESTPAVYCANHESYMVRRRWARSARSHASALRCCALLPLSESARTLRQLRQPRKLAGDSTSAHIRQRAPFCQAIPMGIRRRDASDSRFCMRRRVPAPRPQPRCAVLVATPRCAGHFRAVPPRQGLQVRVQDEHLPHPNRGLVYVAHRCAPTPPRSPPLPRILAAAPGTHRTPPLRAAGHIALNREDSKSFKQFIGLAKRLLSAGASVAIFPEGTRSPDGKLAAFKKGAFTIATQAKAKVCSRSCAADARCQFGADSAPRSREAASFEQTASRR